MDDVAGAAFLEREITQRGSGVALIIVTRDRPVYLEGLLKSIAALTVKPDFLIIVDNASDDATRTTVQKFTRLALALSDIIYDRLSTNTGGAGGFHRGLELALETDANWFWLMDDDVELLPEGLALMLTWQHRFKCFHGQRYDSDGRPFFASQRIDERLAVQIPIMPDPLRTKSYFLTNWACFEGLFIHRDIVLQIGLPDPRFFIVWDDAMYGFRASRITEVAFVDSFVMRRARRQRQISLGIRHLNDASDLTRYYMMRNRALIAAHLRHYGVFRPNWFRLGTALVLAKEIVRLVLVERGIEGVVSLFRGMKEARRLKGKGEITLMPPIVREPPVVPLREARLGVTAQSQ